MNSKKLYKTIELNSNILPIVNVGTYGSLLDASEVFENDLYELEQNKHGDLVEEFWDHFDFDKYKTNIIMQAVEATRYDILKVFQSLDLGIVGVEFEGIDSPDSYNYRNDQLDYSLIVEDGFIQKLNNKLYTIDLVKFNEYLKENFTSYDGFHSLTANNTLDLQREINLYDGDRVGFQEIGAFITYLIDNEDLKDLQETFLENIYQFNDLLETIKDYHKCKHCGKVYKNKTKACPSCNRATTWESVENPLFSRIDQAFTLIFK